MVTFLEIYKFGGPLTTVPISDEFEGMHSSIVWMNKEDYTKKLLNFSKGILFEIKGAVSFHFRRNITNY